jgi:molecular chaperone GrpE
MNDQEQEEKIVPLETETLKKEIEELKDKYLRALAEGENARKRLAKEKQEMLRFGIENAIAEFLPAIDHLETALRIKNSASPEVKNWALGFQMIHDQLREVLHNNGLVAFHSEGNLFDPTYHEAVETAVTTDVPEGTILQEFTKGYKSPSRTIRPARVKVAKAPAPEPLVVAAETVEEDEESKGETL